MGAADLYWMPVGLDAPDRPKGGVVIKMESRDPE
jgi:hypothetical protein